MHYCSVGAFWMFLYVFIYKKYIFKIKKNNKKKERKGDHTHIFNTVN